jgi:peptidoglycan/xylan/chitin deacetylase (PgdA/CDA1 family)
VALRIVADAGLAAVQWDVVMGDPVPDQKISAMVDRVLGRVRPGSIVVGHANGRNYGTAEALEIILPRLTARGFRFVCVSELLLLGKVVTSQECHD